MGAGGRRTERGEERETRNEGGADETPRWRHMYALRVYVEKEVEGVPPPWGRRTPAV